MALGCGRERWRRGAEPRMTALTAELIEQRVRSGEDLTRLDLRRANLAGAQLSGAKLARADLDGANLDGADLSGADLRGASLREVFATRTNFGGAQLRKADLDGARLVRAILYRADLGLANLNGANLEEATLDEASLKHADLVAANLTAASLQRTALTRADLETACLSSARGREVDLSLANLKGARIDGADLVAARLEDSVLEGAFAFKANLDGASLRGAVLLEADFREARLARADLRGARIEGLRLDGAEVAGAKIHGLDFGDKPPLAFPNGACDTSRTGDDSERGSFTELYKRQGGAFRTGVGFDEGPIPRRYVGAGDVLKNAELVFGGSAEILVDGVLRQCEIKLNDAATLVIGESGLLDGCRVFGGRIRIHGRFVAPASVGFASPAELVVFERGQVATQVEQHRGHTRFGFAQGCRLRLNIKSPTPQASEK